MAGAMRKMAVYLGLVEVDDRNRYDDDDDEDAYGSVTPVRSVPDDRSTQRSGRGAYRAERASARGALAVEPQARPEPLEDAVSYRITTLHPRTYNEARTIGEHFRDGTPVIMNLTEMSDGDAKRLVDFAAGLSFGLRGGIERVTAKVFLLSPENVEVTAEDKARIAEGGFFNQS